ncbi:MAG: type II restriction endonuclease [Nanoarchaeota archaeon]|jgi:hypothetical protein|nr:type II restriction endonuclease [Nanoarchaeota archaeon]|tara:strand:+ start:107 stop:655 length:549 start_codon:yes stop_codon:yes gene_type:complete
MKKAWKDYTIKGKKITALVNIFEEGDKKLIRDLYFSWKDVNKRIKEISTRGINLPEAISENAFCFFFDDCVRIVKLKEGKCSYDVINTKTGSRIQIKAASVKYDLTSFGPRSEWDELFFLDFSAGNGSFKVYKIEPDWIYKHMVNRTQTFEEQQKQNRRPRFSITKSLIVEKGLKPIKVCKL